jgi:hypothetical protein
LTGLFILFNLIGVSKPKPAFLAAVFFVSAATLCLEVSLTRYFSISQNYHFAFLVISIAFLGYGASGTFLSFFERKNPLEPDLFLSLSSLLFALSILASFALSNSIPFDFYQLPWDRRQIFLIFPYYLFFGLPFFFAGMTISFAITRLAAEAHKVYFFDLLGAGAGSFFAALVFLPRGEKGVFVLISALALIGCFLFSLKRRPLFLAFLFLLLLAEGLLLAYSPASLSFRLSPYKALPQALRYPQAKSFLTKWNSSYRVDTVDSPAVRFAPGLSLLYGDSLPPQLGVSVDAGELNAVTRFQGLGDPAFGFLSFLPSSFPYFFLAKPAALILEPRGGLDVQAAVTFKASRIKVIESNPLMIGLLRRELASFWGDLYKQKKIEVVFSQVRAALNEEKGRYDLIVIPLTDIFGAAATGLYGIGENYLFTVDAFTRLLDLLSPQGAISLTLYLLPPPRQEAKVLATWIEALENKRLQPSLCIAAIRTWGTLSLFIKKSPFTPGEVDRMRDYCSERLFDTAYYPGIRKEEMNIYNQTDRPDYEDLFPKLLSPSARREFYKDYLFEVEPATDNRPFLGDCFKWTRAKATYAAMGKNPAVFFQGKFLVGALLVQACTVAFILILLPRWIFRREKTSPRGTFWRVFLYFGLVGAAFIFIEIILIQKFILFLGQPLYSVSIVIFSLLLSSGLGSLCSAKILGEEPARRLRGILLLCAGLTAFYLILLSAFFHRFLGLSPSLKMAAALMIIFPLGFIMGMPFPTGIRLLQKTDRRLLPWAWSTNAFSTVIGAILAQGLALVLGYNAVWVLAAGAYLAVFFLLRFADHGNKSDA